MNGVFGALNSIFESSIWHFGDPFGEQKRAFELGAYAQDRSLGFISISGKDRLTWLNTLSTQLLVDLAADDFSQTLFLDTNGRIEHSAWIYHSGQEILAITARDTIENLYNYLKNMIFWSDVHLRLREDLTALRLLGKAIHFPVSPSYGHFRQDLDSIACVTQVVSATNDLMRVEEQLQTAGFSPVGLWAYESARIAALIPRLPLDSDDKTLPHELELVATPEEKKAVHLSKGCYRGQETVSRIHNLGKPPRRLVLLHFDDTPTENIPAGTTITLEGKNIGRLGSSINHYDLGTIALGLIKRSIPQDSILEVARHRLAIDANYYCDATDIPAGKAAILGFKSRSRA